MNEWGLGDLDEQVPRMYRVALRIMGDTEAAQDVVQDAWVKALRGLSRFDGQARLSTWLYRITVNCAMDRLRGAGRLDAGSGGADLAGLADAAHAPPDLAAERRETYELALRLVAELPDDCRAAFVLTQLDGYSYDDAAVIEGQPRGTIASRVFRAKKILMQQLRPHTNGRAQA